MTGEADEQSMRPLLNSLLSTDRDKSMDQGSHITAGVGFSQRAL